MSHKAYALTIGILISTISCQPAENDSELQSLENLTAADGAKLVTHSCSGPYVNKENGDLEKISASKKIMPAVKDALSSIPLSLRALFNAKMLGSINITSDAAKLCGASKKDLSESRLQQDEFQSISCLRDFKDRAGLELVVLDNPKTVRHSLVRAYFAAVLTTMAEANYDDDLEIFLPGKKSIDLANLEKSIQAALKKDLRSKNHVNPNLFSNPIDAVIESADQYYCSKKTRSVMRTAYKNTYRVFKQYYVNAIHAGGEKNPEEIYNEISLAQSPKGTQLWGRWGYGNGPLRSWGRARINARQNGGRGVFPVWNRYRQQGYAQGGRGLFPNWNRYRRQGYAQGGTGLFPNWGVKRHRTQYRYHR